jgi:hypothetical protein
MNVKRFERFEKVDGDWIIENGRFWMLKESQSGFHKIEIVRMIQNWGESLTFGGVLLENDHLWDQAAMLQVSLMIFEIYYLTIAEISSFAIEDNPETDSCVFWHDIVKDDDQLHITKSVICKITR